MDWYKVREKSAGERRLLITWYLYKILGTKIVLVIAFFVAFFTFLLNKDLREYSKKYFEVISEYYNDETLKPSLMKTFRHILSYANSLVYKIETFSGRFNTKKIRFESKVMEEVFFEKIKNKEGMLFLFCHIGNLDVFRSFFINNEKAVPDSVSILLQKSHCETFNAFLNKIEKKTGLIKLYPIEDIDITTVSELDDNLKKGGFVFIAGDRIASNNPEKSSEVMLFGKKFRLPVGTFKLPKILDTKPYFISVIKENKEYNIFMDAQEDLNSNVLQNNFVSFMEKMTRIAPYQFYHFYDIFVDN